MVYRYHFTQGICPPNRAGLGYLGDKNSLLFTQNGACDSNASKQCTKELFQSKKQAEILWSRASI